MAEELSIAVADETNTYTETPPVSGQQGNVHYTLDTFVYDIDLVNPSVTISGSSNPSTLKMEWMEINFIMQMNYHVSVGPVSEKGYVQVQWTTLKLSFVFLFKADLRNEELIELSDLYDRIFSDIALDHFPSRSVRFPCVSLGCSCKSPIYTRGH